MNLASAPGSLAITSYTNLFGGATLTLLSGTQPVSAETALSGNTSLYTFVFNTPPFSTLATAGGFDTLTASIAAGTFVAGGTASFARVTFGTPVARANTTAYVRGSLVTASSLLWVCIAPGTTSGTSTLTASGYGIVDGTAAFDYVGASSVTVLCDLTVGTSGTDIVLGTTAIATGVTVSISSFKMQVAVA
jgi:hypothetical protein